MGHCKDPLRPIDVSTTEGSDNLSVAMTHLLHLPLMPVVETGLPRLRVVLQAIRNETEPDVLGVIYPPIRELIQDTSGWIVQLVDVRTIGLSQRWLGEWQRKYIFSYEAFAFYLWHINMRSFLMPEIEMCPNETLLRRNAKKRMQKIL